MISIEKSVSAPSAPTTANFTNLSVSFRLLIPIVRGLTRLNLELQFIVVEWQTALAFDGSPGSNKNPSAFCAPPPATWALVASGGSAVNRLAAHERHCGAKPERDMQINALNEKIIEQVMY